MELRGLGLLALAIVLSGTIFIFDMTGRWTLLCSVPDMVLVLAGLWLPRWYLPVSVSAATFLSMFPPVFHAFQGKTNMEAMINHLLCLLAIWLAAVFCLSYKRNEEQAKALLERFFQADKLTYTGKLASTLAHEFNNPLFGVRSVIETIKDGNTVTDEEKSLLKLALKECDRMTNLVSRLREFYAPASANATSIDANVLIGETILLVEKRLKQKGIAVITRLCDQPGRVKGLADQLKQVLINLIQNAEESISKEHGSITIETKCSASNFIFTVTDTGCGISQENLKNIFDPFFSTKYPAKGSGLGLSICHNIIKKHNGSLFAESDGFSGTTFTVELPRTQEPS